MKKLLQKIILLCALFIPLGFISGCGSSGGTSFESPTITLSDKKVSLSIGSTYQLEAETSETKMIVYWFTRDVNIASVDNNGLVTALSVGTTVCYAQVGSNTAMCSITVTPYEPDASLYVTSSKTDILLSVGDEYKLPIEVKYGEEFITDYSSKVSIEDEAVCSYSNGTVTALSNGVTTLLLTIIYEQQSDQLAFIITVTE